MKNETKVKNETTGVYALAQKVLNLLNIGEDAKINNFFAREIKKSEKAIRDLKRNITTLENKYHDSVDDINEKLDDAREAVEEAKTEVTLADVKTNDACDQFAPAYWGKISEKMNHVSALEKDLEDLKRYFDEQSEYVNSKIEKHQKRIDMIKK